MMNPGPPWLKKSHTDNGEKAKDQWTEQSIPDIPMYQCGLCCVRFRSPNELINHVEKGEHFQISKESLDGVDVKDERETDVLTLSVDLVSDEEKETQRSSSVIVRSTSSQPKIDPLLHFADEPMLETVPHFGEEPKNLVKREQAESMPYESAGLQFSHFEEGSQGTTSTEHNLPDDNKAFFKCIKCPATFDTALGLKSHRSAHALDCPFCGDSFYIKPSLDRHIREKHDAEKDVPSDNPVVTTFASDVLIEPTQDGCYGCKICGKVCAARSDMSKHVRRHTDERPYSCSICSDRFKHRSAITNHMRIHTGEKPYSCLYCPKKFSQPSNKRRHEALHRGERPFSCDICKRSFSEKTTLQTHVLQHTGERPYVCDVCGKGHITNSALTQHKRTRHNQRTSGSGSPGDVDVT